MSSAPSVPAAIPGQRTSTMAIIAFVAAFVVPVAGLVLGILARREIRRTHEAGDGLARAGFILGFVFTAGQLVFFIVWLGMFASIFSQVLSR